MRTQCPILVSALVLALLFPHAARAFSPAQESEDPRFKKAQEFWDSPHTPGNLESACQIMTELVKEKDTKQYRQFQKEYCNQAKSLLATEQDVYRRGKQAADNGDCVTAKAFYDGIAQILTKDPQYRNGLKQIVADCQSRAEAKRQEQEKLQKQTQQQEEEKRWEGCIASEQAGKYDDAQACFEQVRSTGGSKAGEAIQHLTKLTSLRQEDDVYNEGVGFFNTHNRGAAREEFQKITQGRHLADAQHYLERISQEEKKLSTDELLRSGLRCYFDSDFTQAERYLKEYVSKGGQKQWMGYFFLGAAHSAQYFLSQDGNEMKQAKEGFLKAQSSAKQTSSKDEIARVQRLISPRIWDLYLRPQ